MSETTEIVSQETQLSVAQSIKGISASDIDILRINIVQKMSDIEAPTGSIVLDKQFILAGPETTLNTYVLFAEKLWKEDIPFDDDETPRIVASEEAASKLKLDSNFEILEFANITVLVEQPEGDENDDAYTIPLGDKQYAMGKFTAQKDAYRRTFKALATYAMLHPDEDISAKVWGFASQPISKGKYSWFTPVLRATSETPNPEVVAFRKKLGF